MKSFKEKTKKMLFIPIGISGSGKGYYFKNSILKQFPELEKRLEEYSLSLKDIIVCPDDIRREVTGDVSNQTRNPYVWVLTDTRTKHNMKHYGVSILDATNTDGKNRNSFIGKFPDVEKIAIVFRPDIELSFSRISNDIETGIDRSNVPMSALERQFAQFKTSVVGDTKWNGEWNESTKNKIREQLKTKFDVIKFVD
jgi:predicted kinase